MTNREWLLNKMQNMSDEEFADTIFIPDDMKKQANCGDKNCESKSCNDCKLEWLKSEHKEKITLSEAERIILENIPKKYKWIARDSDDEIRVFNKQPKEDAECSIWVCGIGEENARLSAFNHLFQFITWNDEQPYNIEELLKNENRN